MKLRRPPDRAQPETIVALIDVVFFLLVFFMLVGRMDANAPFEVTPPYAETGGDMPAGGATISVSESGALAFDGFARPRQCPPHRRVAPCPPACRRDGGAWRA